MVAHATARRLQAAICAKVVLRLMASSAATHSTCAPIKVRRRHASEVSISREIRGVRNMVASCVRANILPASEKVSPQLCTTHCTRKGRVAARTERERQ